MGKWRTNFHKAKRIMGDTYNTSMKWISIADRAHALLSKGFSAVEDQLEPEAHQAVGSALHTYGRRRRQLANVDQNNREIGGNLQRASPQFLGP